MDQNTNPQDNSNIIATQNTEPVDQSLSIDEFVKQYEAGTLPSLNVNMPEHMMTGGPLSFSDQTSAYYNELRANLQKDIVKEDYDNAFEATYKIIGATLGNFAAALEDTIGAFDIGDWRVPEMLGVGTVLNEGFKFWDNYIWGDGEDETGNYFTRRAEHVREMNQKLMTVNTGTGWLDGLDYVLNLIPSFGSVAGYAATGFAGARVGAAAGLGKITNSVVNAWLSTEATGLGIAEGNYDKIYDEVAGRLDPDFRRRVDSAYNEAYQEAVASGANAFNAEWQAKEAVRAFKKIYDQENPKNSKIARESAAKGADASLQAEAPAFLLNILTAGYFTRGLYKPNTILSKPSRISAKTVFAEGGQEFVEEGLIERRAEDLGYNVGVKGEYTNTDLWNTIVNTQTLEAGLIGFVLGGGMGGFADLGTFKDRKEKYETQQERIEIENRIGNAIGKPDLINDLTNLQRNFFQIQEMGNTVGKLRKEGKIEEAEALNSRMLGVQAVEAFKAGTTKNLIENYQKIANDPTAKPEVTVRARQAVNEILEMEKMWNNTVGKYANDSDVFLNRINKIELGKAERELKTKIAEQRILADEAVQSALQKGETSLTADIVETTIDEYNQVVADSKVTGQKQLGYDLDNLSENNYTDENERKVYDNFRTHATNNIESVRQLVQLQERLKQVQENKNDNESTYNKITSKEYQKSVKAERRLYETFKAGEAELQTKEGTDEYMMIINQIMKKYEKTITPERFEKIKKQLELKNEVVKTARKVSQQNKIVETFSSDENEDFIPNLDTNNGVRPDGSEPKVKNSQMLNVVASKLATGRKNELTSEESDFLLTYGEQVDKRVRELQQDPDSIEVQPNVNDEIDEDSKNLLSQLENAVDDSDLMSNPTPQSLPSNKANELVETKTTNVTAEEQAALDQFKDGKITKALLHRAIGANYKSVVESLKNKGLITEEGNEYKRNTEPESGLSSEQQTVNNLLNSGEFTPTENGLVLQIKEPKDDDKKEALENAIKLLKEQIKNNQLPGYEVKVVKDPFNKTTVYQIYKPLTNSITDTENQVSKQPNLYDEGSVSDEKKEEIKDIVNAYVANMESFNDVFPTFEEFIRHIVKTAGRTKADKYFHVLHSGWKMNGYPEVKDPIVIWEKVFQDSTTLNARLTEVGDEVSVENRSPRTVSQETNKELESDESTSNKAPIHQDPETKERKYGSNSYTTEDTRPKMAFTVLESKRTYDETEEDGQAVVTTTFSNKGQTIREQGTINSLPLLNFLEVKAGTEFEVFIPEGNLLMEMIIPVREESGPLKDAIKVDDQGNKLTTTFGEWLNSKLATNPDFKNTQEYLDRLPMLYKNKDGVYVAAVHETLWYNKTVFRGDLNEARANNRAIRQAALNAKNSGKKFSVKVSEVRGGSVMKLESPKRLKDVNPQAKVGLLIKDKLGKHKFYVNNKLFTGNIINLDNVVGSTKATNNIPVDVRVWGIDAEGNPIYKAYLSTKMPLNQAQQNTVFNTLFAFLTINSNLSTEQKSQARNLQRNVFSITGLDITSFNDLSSFIKQFVQTSNYAISEKDKVTKLLADPTPENLSAVGKMYAKLINNIKGKSAPNLPYLMIEGNNIIFGNVGDAEAVVLTPNEMNTDTGKAKLAKLKDNLVNQELNIGIKYNGPTVHVDNNLGVEQMSENYAQYLKDNLYTFVNSVNVGTEQKPVYATNLQPIIHIEPAGVVSRKEGQVTVSNKEVTPKQEQKNTAVLESATQEDLKEAVIQAEEEGWKFQGETVEEKAKDLENVIAENNSESTELVDKYLDSKETSIEDVNEFNKLISQAESQVKWVNEYFNNDGSVNQSYQPAELTDSEVEAMDKDVMRIKGLMPNHQFDLAQFLTINIANAIKEDQKIDLDKLRAESKKQLVELLKGNKELLQETLAKLKATPNADGIAKIVNLINKYEYALSKIDLVLDNSNILFDQAVAFILKDSGAKLVEDKVETKDKDERVVNDQDDQDTTDSDEGFSYETDNTIGSENYSKTSLEENHKSSVSFNLRRFMRGFREVNPKTKAFEVGAMGVPLYVDFDSVFDVLQSILADAPVDFDTMIDILEQNKDKQPWIPQVIEKLKQSDNELKNQFVTTMGKHALNMEFLMYSFDKDGKVTMSVTNTNSGSISNKIKNQWLNNLVNSQLITEDKEVNRNIAEQLYEVYNGWTQRLDEVKTEFKNLILGPTIRNEIAKGDRSVLLQGGELTLSKKSHPNVVTDNVLNNLNKDKKITINNAEYRLTRNGDSIIVTPYKKSVVSSVIDGKFRFLSEEDQQLAIDSVQEWLANFGIEMSDNALKFIFENGIMHKGALVNTNEFFAESETSGGVIGLLGNWLNRVRSTDSDTPISILDDRNNPLNQSAILKTLAFHQGKYSSNVVTNAFRDGKKSIYGFTAFKYITDRANELKNNKQFRDNLRELSFNGNSLWLSFFNDFDQVDRINFQDIFNVSHLGLTAIKELGKKVYKDNSITAISDIDHEYLKIGLFEDSKQGKIGETYGSSKIGLRTARFLFPTMSDKSTMTVVKTLALELADKKHYEYNEKGELLPKRDILEILFDQLVLPEIKRINKVSNMKNGTDIKSYDKGAKMFLFLPKLNELKISVQGDEINLVDILTTPGTDFNKVLIEENKEKILAEVQNYVTALVNEKLNVWQKNGYVSKNANDEFTNNLLDEKYFNDINDSSVTDKKTNISDTEKVKLAAFDFEINQMLANVNAFMTIIGDPALYYKVSNEGSKSYTQKSKETFDNVGKRLAAMIAPGSKLADSENEQYTQIFLDDRNSISENIDFITEVLDNKTFDRQRYNEILSKEPNTNDPVKLEEFKRLQEAEMKVFLADYPNSKGYFKIQSTDAQEYTTWQEHMHILEKLGRLNDSTVDITPEEIREAKQMFANGLEIEKMSDKQKGILKKVLQPIKPVYTGQIFDKEQDVMRMVYIKTSSFPLIPQVTKGLQLENLRNLMEAVQTKQGNFVRASYDSGNKVGAMAKPLSIFDKEGKMKDFVAQDENGKVLKDEDGKVVYNTDEAIKASLPLNRKDFKIQLDVPYKSLKRDEDTISLGTQLTKILFGNGMMNEQGFMFEGTSMVGSKLEQEFTKAFIELADLKKTQLFDELGIDPKTGQPKNIKETFNKLQELLKNEAINRGYSKQDIAALELEISNVQSELMSFEDVRFKMPLWLSSNSNRFESLLNAIVSNRLIKIKMSGNSYIAGSEEGFKFQTDLKGIDENRIVWTSKWNGQSLQGSKFVDGKTKIQFAQVLAPSKFRKPDGTLIDLLEFKDGKHTYVTKTDSGFRLKEDMIDPELLSLTSFRIPTSGHNSGSQIEIVGFLPQEKGDLMVVPKNFTTQKGLDFDVDKENTYQLWHEMDEDGKIKVVKEGDREKILQNKIINIHKSIYSNPRKSVQKKINTVLSTDYAEDQAAQIDGWLSESKDDQYFTALSSEYQKNKLISAASGKIGTGAYSLDVTSQSLFEQAKVKGNQLSARVGTLNEEGEFDYVNYSVSFGREEQEGKVTGLLGNERTLEGSRTIAEVLSELQNIAVDNEKLQVMGKVNLNSFTLDASKAMAMLGFDKSKVTGNSIQFTFLSQPILLEYVKEMANASSDLTEFSLNKEQKVIQKLLAKYDGNYLQDLSYDKDKKNSIFLSMGAMEAQLQSKTVDNKLQLAVLNRFLQLKKIGENIRNIQTTINLDSKGLSKSIFENSEKVNSIIALAKNPVITNADKLIGDIITPEQVALLSPKEKSAKIKEGYVEICKALTEDGNFTGALIKPTTISGSFAINALSTADKLWSSHFPYDSPVFKAIVDELTPLLNLGEASEFKKAQRRKEITNEIKRYLNTHIASKTLFRNTDAQEERYRLFRNDASGKDSLASYLKKTIGDNPVLSKNKLLQRLDFEVNTDGKPSFIKFNSSASTVYDEDFLNNSLLDLMQRNVTLGNFNGQPYTSRMLAQDLISYSYLEGGVQEAIQFVKFAPLSYLDAKGFTQGMRDINFTSGFDVFGMNPDNTDQLSTFAIQFAQNNPNLMPKLDSIVDKKKAIALARNPSFKASALNYNTPQIVSIKSGDNFLLYKKEGDTYRQIPVAGTFGMAEYNNKPGAVKSLISPPLPKVIKTEEALNPVSENTKVANEERYDLGQSNLRSSLTKISNDPNLPESLTALASALLNSIDENTTFIVEDLTADRAKGVYRRDVNQIGIDIKQAQGASDVELARTILKEAVHSVTDKELLKHVDANGNLKTNNAPSHVLALVKLFNQVRGLPEFQKALQNYQEKTQKKIAFTKEEARDFTSVYYGGYNILEFVEMILTQPEFQQEMAKIKTPSGNSILDLFKDFFAKLFKNLGMEFESDTIAAQAIENALIVIDEKGKVKKETKPEVKPISKNKVSDNIKSFVNSLIPNWINNKNNELSLASEFKSIQLLSEGESTIEDRINFGKEAEELIREGVRGKNPFKGVTFESQIPNLLYAVISGKLAESNISEKDMYDNIFSTQPEVQPTTTTQATTVSAPVNNDLLAVFERVNNLSPDDVQLVDDIDFNEFENYPNILDYLNNDLGVEVLEYNTIKANKDVIEKLLSEIDGDKNIYSLLAKLKSQTNKEDKGLTSNVTPTLTVPTGKEEDLLKQTESIPGLKRYELLPNVFANEEQTKALDNLDTFVNSPRDKSEKYQSTFVLSGASGTGKQIIVNKIIQSNPGKKIVNTQSIYDIYDSKVLNENTDIIIINNCSMLSKSELRDIYSRMSPNTKVVFIGDKAMLPPIGEDNDSVSFNLATKPEYNVELTQRLRQGETSPIVAYSDILRNETKKETLKRRAIQRRVSNFDYINNKGILFANEKQMSENLNSDIKSDPENTKVITHSDELASKSNDRIREILWGKVGAQNEYNIGEVIFNDIYGFYTVKNVRKINNAEEINGQLLPGYELTLETDAETITVKVLSKESKAILEKSKISSQETIDFKYGYAITAQQAQGSTFNNVYIMEDNIINSPISDKQVNQSLYVAMNSSKNKVVIYSKENEAGEGRVTKEEFEGMTDSGISLQPSIEELIEGQIDELMRKGIIKSKCN